MSMDSKIASLYLEKKLSGPEIAQTLKISQKQVYRALRKQGITRRSAKEQSQIRFQSKPKSYSFKENLSTSERELCVAALMLYWGEGAKTESTVDLTNSDPDMVKVFLKFLREIARVDESKLRVYLYCFEDQDPRQLIRFWAKELRLPFSAFTKPYVRRYPTSRQVRAHSRKAYGVAHLRYNDKRLLEKILRLWSDLVAAWAA